MILRDFRYLDRRLVRTFLAQAEGGVIEEATERTRSTGKGGVGARLGTSGAGLTADKSRENATESEAVVHQVAASEFDRLYSYLEADDLLVVDQVDDLDFMSQIHRKQFLELDAHIQVSGLQKLLQLFGAFSSIVPQLKQLGTEIDVDDDTIREMQSVVSLMSSADSLPVVATVAGDANLQIGLELEPSSILTDEWDIDASILLKVQRLIKGQERHFVGEGLGGLLKVIPAADRAKMMESLQSPEAAMYGVGPSEISAPGLLGTAVAIYL